MHLHKDLTQRISSSVGVRRLMHSLCEGLIPDVSQEGSSSFTNALISFCKMLLGEANSFLIPSVITLNL